MALHHNPRIVTSGLKVTFGAFDSISAYRHYKNQFNI